MIKKIIKKNGKFWFNDVFVLMANKTPFKLLKISIKGN